MACCLAAALVIGAVRTVWFKLFPSRRPVELAFAPPARRPAPGVPGAWHLGTPAPAPAVPLIAPDLALVAAGVAWLVLTEIAAHVLHLVPHSDLLHAPGPLLMTIGLALRLRSMTTPTPA